MKKLIESIILATIILSFSIMVFANSGPVFWQGYPSSDVMSIDVDSPISVKSENLVFDFSDDNSFDYSIAGKVTATYEMVNPTEESQSVQMAFPFVEALNSLSPESVVISADGRVLPYDIYFGAIVESRGNPRYDEKEASLDFANILDTITKEPYKAESFGENEKGKLYTIDVKPTTNQDIEIAVHFNLNSQKTKVLTNGFNGYERNNESTKITAYCDKPITLEIFVLGEDINIYTNAFKVGEQGKETDLFNYEISTGEVELKPYLLDYIKKNTNARNDSIIFNTQLYNLYAKALDRHFKINMGYCFVQDLLEQEYYKRIMTLVYTVEFPKNSEKEVSVSYKTSGTMDKTETAKPLYSFDYILNPAKNWSDFENLNIEIITPQEAPYIVKSSVDLIKGENKIYTAALADLPKEDLSFTLYANKNITLLDKAAGNLQNTFGYFAPFAMGTLVIIGIIIVMFVLTKMKNR
jgi:hypothetical protein